MFRFAFVLALCLELGWLMGCSDVSSMPDLGTGATGGSGISDLPAATRPLTLGCTNSVTPDLYFVTWELTVDPGPILGGEPFGAVFSGTVIFDEYLLDQAQGALVGGSKRSNVLDVQATVRVRSGVAPGAMDVVLTNEPIARTCAYDEHGHNGPNAGPRFPRCSETDDNPDGSNEGCTGLGGSPDPANVCGQFLDTPTSSDCNPGGFCDDRGKTGPGSQCALNGFCVAGPVPLALKADIEGYLADESGTVLFGWDDASTGAVLDESGGPGRGRWILPSSLFDEPTSNSVRVMLGGIIPAALDCTMGEGSASVLRPTRDTELVAFPIQTP
ncbi:MAG: hypothetical protein WCE62_08285 [Polyangiales bacterium]